LQMIALWRLGRERPHEPRRRSPRGLNQRIKTQEIKKSAAHIDCSSHRDRRIRPRLIRPPGPRRPRLDSLYVATAEGLKTSNPARPQRDVNRSLVSCAVSTNPRNQKLEDAKLQCPVFLVWLAGRRERDKCWTYASGRGARTPRRKFSERESSGPRSRRLEAARRPRRARRPRAARYGSVDSSGCSSR
jgi:hypothetical protein